MTGHLDITSGSGPAPLADGNGGPQSLDAALARVAELESLISRQEETARVTADFYLNGLARTESVYEKFAYMVDMFRSQLSGAGIAAADANAWIWLDENPYSLRPGAILGEADEQARSSAVEHREGAMRPVVARGSHDRYWALVPLPDTTSEGTIGTAAIELTAPTEISDSISTVLMTIAFAALMEVDRTVRITSASRTAQFARAAARAQLRLTDPAERTRALTVAIDELASCDDLGGGAAFEIEGGELRRAARFGTIDDERAEEIVRSGDASADPGHHLLTIVVDHRTEAAIVISQAMHRQIGDHDMLDSIAAAVAGSIARARATGMIESLRRSATRRLVEAQERERSMVAADIHDGVLQQLGATAIRLELAQARVENSDFDAARKIIDDATGEIRSCARELRALLMELRPQVLDDNGLKAALYELGRHVDGVVVEVSAEVPPEIGNEYSITVFRIVQEALTNIQKHAQATEASVDVTTDEHHLAIMIRDNGVGYEGATTGPSSAGSHLGLLGMRERARMLGGEFAIEGASGGGTVVRALLPLKAPQQSEFLDDIEPEI